jgi:hypothetical protein
MSVTRRTFLEVAGFAAAAMRFQTPVRSYTLEPGPNGKILRDPAGQSVPAYLTSKPGGLAGNSASCIHPLNTLAGERVTDLAPPDQHGNSQRRLDGLAGTRAKQRSLVGGNLHAGGFENGRSISADRSA